MAIIKTKFDRGVEGATNIVDAGTEGTKVASGTTAQRGSTTGQFRFNTTTGFAEYYNGSEFKAIDTPPTITSVDVTNVATDSGGTETFVITGTLFNSGVTVKFRDNGGTEITPDTTTRNSSSQITVTKTRSSFSNANEPYDIIVTNPSGLSVSLDNQINVDNSPAWTTASGSLGTIFSNDTGNHFTVAASDPDGDTIAYSETGGTVLSNQNLTLNSSTGVISGDPTDVSSDTTLNFDLRATANSQTADRSFSIILRPPKTIDTVDIFGDSSALALYNCNSNGNDLGGNYNATVGSSVTFQSSGGKYGGYAAMAASSSHSDGMTYYGDDLANQLRPSTNFSYSWWFRNSTTTGLYKTIHGSNAWWYFYMNDNNSASTMRIKHYNTGSTTNINFSGTFTNSGGWNHAVVTNPSGTGSTKLYINGSLAGSDNSVTSTSAYQSGSKRITLTADSNRAHDIDQIRIFNKELSSSEVTTLYNEVG
mgnify:FL=1